MNHLKKYLEEELKSMVEQDDKDYEAAANRMIMRMLDPTYTPTPPSAKRNYTKVESYRQFMDQYQGNTAQAIYSCIASADTPLSRAQIADRLEMRVATVCGRVSELMEGNCIEVYCVDNDTDTNRKVEFLSILGNNWLNNKR